MGIKNTDNVKAQQEYGTLYIVSTPIGNLEDITLRALKILKNVDLIACENKRHTKGLCNHYGIKTRLISYHQHNRKTRGPELIEKLKRGSIIALVTNAGTPVISDPGALLIGLAHEQGIKVSPIPGPSAAITALSICGLRVDRFLYFGFLSNRPGKRKKELGDLIHESKSIVFYEAPHRIISMLKDLKDVLGDRQVVILRELTKVYEEIKRGPISSILRELDANKIKGEFTVVVAGEEKRKNGGSLDKETKSKILELLKKNRLGVKEIATRLSRGSNLKYREIYREGLNLKKEVEK